MIEYIKIENLINNCSEVFITAHKNIDLDALGSILGIYYIVNNLGKKAHIVIDDDELNKEVLRALNTIYSVDDIKTSTFNEIEELINDESLLIVTDTSNKNRIQNDKLLKIKNKIVIDHHIESESSIPLVTYKYIDTSSSSATEIVLDLINELNIYIPKEVATIMLSGMYIDTNGFMVKTTEKTHIYASMLYKFGADSKEAQYLLKQNFNEFKRRQKLTLSTEIIGKFAITLSNSVYSSVELAKSSDVLLTFNNIEASFSIAKIDDDIIGISARSLGNVDVEDVMKKFNGGGHKTDAACQIKGKTIEEVKNELLEVLGGLE